LAGLERGAELDDGTAMGALAESLRIELDDGAVGLDGRDVSAAIRGEAPVLLGREDAVGQARTIDELYRSAAR